MTLICRHPAADGVIKLEPYALDLIVVHVNTCSGEHWVISDMPRGQSFAAGVYAAKPYDHGVVILPSTYSEKERNT